MISEAVDKQEIFSQQKIAAELVHLLYSQALSAIAGTLLIATILTVCLYQVVPDYKLFSWYALVLTIAAIRAAAVKFYMQRLPVPSQHIFWRRIFITMAALAGCSWSLAAFYLMPENGIYQILVACALSGVAAGAIPFFSGSRLACAAFITPILISFSAWSVLQSDRPHDVLAVITVVYWAILLLSASKTHQVIYKAVKLKFTNDLLVANLAAARNQMDFMNNSLNEETKEKMRINYLATHDTLTDLPNRNLFISRFTQALEDAALKNTCLALLFLDLDNFKNINDTQGHDMGDMLLIKVAERVKKCIRPTDTLARLGGDEFTVLLEDINTEALTAIATKICEAFNEPFQLHKQELFITTSIGISIYPGDGADMQTLFKNADLAIYRAKEKGKNTFEFFTPALNEKFQRKTMIESNLRNAVENKEFTVFYQPVIDIQTNTISSLEALLRWENPVLGSISPVEFIPVAEESGLIVSIGDWVLRQVCQQNLFWRETELIPKKLRLAVNLSSRQFKEAKLVEQITAILKETGVSGEVLTLEITEGLIMQEIETSIKTLKKLKDLGITISIDDFGTGYSSLNYLRRFPIDIIKIDRSFVMDINNGENNDDAAAIITAIIALSHSLKMKVIAEGVETIPQYNFLRSLDCDQIQGFLISKPVPVTEITAFLQRAFSYENYLKFRRFDKDYADKRWEEYHSKYF